MAKIRGIELSSGESRPLSDSITERQHEAIASRLLNDGFDCYIQDDRDVTQLCYEAIDKTLQNNDINPGSIDAVFFAIESFWDTNIERISDDIKCEEHLKMRNGMMAVLSKLKLSHAYPYGIWMAACNNFGSAISVANSLIRSGQHARILLVVGERHNRSLSRFTQSGSSIYSDLIAACVIDTQAPGFEVEEVALAGSTKIAQLIRDEQEPIKLLEMNRTLKRLKKEFEAKSNCAISDFKKVVIANYHIDQLKTICETLSIDASTVLREYRGTLAHGYSMDTLASLKKLKNDGVVCRGDRVLLVNTAIEMWSLISLTVD